jgi:6-phosphogluconolactonase
MTLAAGLLAASLAVGTARAAQAPACASAACGGELAYIATRGAGPGQGLFAIRLDPRTGRLTAIGLAAQLDMPSWIIRAASGLYYATRETSPGAVVTLKADPVTGQLQPIGETPSQGSGPPFLSIDEASKTVFVANFNTGEVATLPVLADGALGPAASVQKGYGTGGPASQAGLGAHALLLDPSRRFALATNLGADRIFIYHFDPATRQLAPSDPAFEDLPPASGPRHIVFAPSGRFMFLINQLSAEVRVYRWDRTAGRLTLVQALSTVLPTTAQKSASEIALTRDGRFLYVSNRGENTIVAYAVNRQTGRLRALQRVSAQGATPWGFSLDPTERWLLVANLDSNAVNELKRDRATGRLEPTEQAVAVPRPDGLVFAAP